jgi:hypothetical protein
MFWAWNVFIWLAIIASFFIALAVIVVSLFIIGAVVSAIVETIRKSKK